MNQCFYVERVCQHCKGKAVYLGLASDKDRRISTFYCHTCNKANVDHDRIDDVYFPARDDWEGRCRISDEGKTFTKLFGVAK